MHYLRNFTISFLLLFLTFSTALNASAGKPVSIVLPDSLIQDIIQKALPANVPIQAKAILGSVSVDGIKNLTLNKDRLSGHVTLSGHDLNLVTNIAGHKLRMKIGSLTMGFQCDATVRFDAKSQILYIKPVITDLQSTDKAKAEIASLIAQLFNNREFPMQLNKLKPFSADTGEKTLHITMRVSGVSIHPGEIHLQAVPTINSTPKAHSNKKRS